MRLGRCRRAFVYRQGGYRHRFRHCTLGWENLTPMPTGYGSGDSGPFVGFNEVIDTTTSSGGLNPLPQGSIAVTWSATVANASGFKGYGPSYSAPNPHPGSQQVYYGFLRDEKNIYTSPTNPPGAIPYSVTISGLRSVWTNTPYAIQLIAATDTGMLLTNAFISSSTSTQMVAYDTTNLTYANGIMGGLSTMSGPWTNDSLSIYGAPASYGYSGKPETGYAIASTIAGFIITDKPVITHVAAAGAGLRGGHGHLERLCGGRATARLPVAQERRAHSGRHHLVLTA